MVNRLSSLDAGRPLSHSLSAKLTVCTKASSPSPIGAKITEIGVAGRKFHRLSAQRVFHVFTKPVGLRVGFGLALIVYTVLRLCVSDQHSYSER